MVPISRAIEDVKFREEATIVVNSEVEQMKEELPQQIALAQEVQQALEGVQVSATYTHYRIKGMAYKG